MASYKTIFTRLGAQLLIQAASTGQAVLLTKMAVGDGNGQPTSPSATQTTMVRERYRGNINRIYQDPNDKTRFTAELVIPANTDAFTLREVGVFDSNGTMIMIGSLPDMYKPAPDEGAYSDVVVAVDFFLTNDAVINISFDPNTVIVNQTWLVNNWTAAQLIPGGTVGQVLGKESNADGDYVWQDPSVANVTVDTVAETQLLAANQTTVDLTKTTTYGLAVYVAGERLAMGTGADEWQPVANNPTRITLGKSYTAGTKIQMVNNEPAGSAPAPLERAKNLSDVLDANTARNNLSVYSRGEIDGFGRLWAPPGMVMPYANSYAPTGWLRCNGTAVSRTAYAALFAAIGTTFGAGDGFNTFNLPDLRGEFIRGWDDARGVDPSRVIGSRQDQSLQSHAHTGTTNNSGSHTHGGVTDAQGNHAHSVSGSTSPAGNHGHTAWTDSQGNHNHGVGIRNPANYGGSAGYYGIRQIGLGSGAWAQGGGQTNSEALTSVDGLHGHNVGIGAVGDHAHSVSGSTTVAGNHAHNLSIYAVGDHAHSFTTSATGSAETRPRNVALLYCIKY